LRAIASIYESLGLLSPVIIQCKMCMQQLWQTSKLGRSAYCRVEETLAKIQQKLPIVNGIQT